MVLDVLLCVIWINSKELALFTEYPTLHTFLNCGFMLHEATISEKLEQNEEKASR